jgi:hypothetical protein
MSGEIKSESINEKEFEFETKVNQSDLLEEEIGKIVSEKLAEYIAISVINTEMFYRETFNVAENLKRRIGM